MNVDFLKGKYGMQVMLFLMITLVSYIIFGLLATTFIGFYYEVGVADLEAFAKENTGASYILLIAQQVGFFLLPALVFSSLISGNRLSYLKLNFNFPSKYRTTIILFALTVIPVMGFLSDLNGLISLPDFAGSMEESAVENTSKILENRGVLVLFLNILVIALLPAIGEELFFRGVIQKLFTKQLRNHHASIFITGFLFSFIHLQFYTFLPRFFMGIMLGYLLYWSRSIIVPIIAHFLNNLIGVLAFYYWGSEVAESGETNVFMLIVSVIILVVLSSWYSQKKEIKL
jgi:membrane protease YdiL (CAAX protease family)